MQQTPKPPVTTLAPTRLKGVIGLRRSMSNQGTESFLEGYYFSFSCFFFPSLFAVFIFWFYVQSSILAIIQTTIFLACNMVFFIFIKNVAISSSIDRVTTKELTNLNLIGFLVGPALVLVALLIQSIMYFFIGGLQ